MVIDNIHNYTDSGIMKCLNHLLCFLSNDNIRLVISFTVIHISNSIKQLAGSFGIALLTVVFTARTALHAAHETQQTPQTYVEGVTDALTVVVWITLAAALPLLGAIRRKKKPRNAGPKSLR